MPNPQKFKEICIVMGGEYSEEYGMLEPDIGGDHISEYEALKQWCDFSHLENVPAKGLTVFRSPRHIELQSELFTPTARPHFDEFFTEEYKPEEQTMCFKSTTPDFSSIVEGVSQFCITTYPREEPRAVWMGFPDWGILSKRR